MGKVLVIKGADFSNICVEKISLEVNITAICIPAEGGNVEGLGVFDKGSSVEIIANPNIGFRFRNWEDGSTESIRNIIADIRGTAYVAYFAKRTGNLINIDLTTGASTPVYQSTDGGTTFSLNNTGYGGWSQINVPLNGETMLEGKLYGYNMQNLIIPLVVFLDESNNIVSSTIPSRSGSYVSNKLRINIPSDARTCVISVFTGDKDHDTYYLDQECYIY